MSLEAEIMAKLNEFVNSDSGKKFLREKGIYNGVTAKEAHRMATDLNKMLIVASMKVTKSKDSLFPVGILTSISESQSRNQNAYYVTINYDAGSFYRPSLLNKKGGSFIGVGAYDIVGLFTKGYSPHRIYGWWEYKNTLVSGKVGLKGKDFVDKAIDKFKKKYEKKYKNLNITVSYPTLWHS